MAIKKGDIALTFDFGGIEAAETKKVCRFRDFKARRFLIGYCRHDKHGWIMGHHQYNVRVDDAKRIGNVDPDNPITYAVDYLILYENSHRNSYKVYRVKGCERISRDEIAQKGYPNPHCDYFLYSFGEDLKFEPIALVDLIGEVNQDNRYKPIFMDGATLYQKYRREKQDIVGLVDADLLDGGTRHPNLALLKIAGYLFDNDVSFELITETDADVSGYKHIYMSKVFTFTKEPLFYQRSNAAQKKKFHIGGTGYYANEKSISKFRELRNEDMERLSHDAYLNTLVCKHSGQNGIDMATQMPYYHLYDEYVQSQVEAGFNREKYKDYLNYSIGFLTRKCYRHCPFCVNKLEDGVTPYSKLEWFQDKSRPHVYFWDDNFLAAPYEVWKPALQHLIDNKISFQFRQGLDERQLAESPHGEEMAEMLSRAKYHGDFIFAFDNWKDRPVIEQSLRIWKHYNPKKGTKFYLFCGFMLTENSDQKFYKDIRELFLRIQVLMQYGCVGYVMRHEDYKRYELGNFYVQVARWCNQQAFYKKMSFWEFTYRNQSFWEETTLKRFDRPKYKTYEEVQEDIRYGYYQTTKMCKTLQTVLAVIDRFREHHDELLEMFNYKMEELIDPKLWINQPFEHLIYGSNIS